MSRYIDADNVMSAFDRVCNDCGMRDTVICDSCKFDGARVIVENTPTADVKPIVWGEWKYPNGVKTCNICNAGIASAYDNYCPHCGARMKGEQTE